jgi:hypothetical protein
MLYDFGCEKICFEGIFQKNLMLQQEKEFV